jgi:hypothetical protein
VKALDVAVGLRATSADARVGDLEPGQRAREGLTAKLVAVVGENPL